MSQLGASVEHGGGGGYAFASTGSAAPSANSQWLAFTATEACTVSATGNLTLSTFAVPSGVTIFGRWSSFTVDSGKGIAYEG